ncbi:hypothetical protein [Levilactobacillus parabrevis]|uniref:hypothetical protein n=1 Tax=Levilactobacillus parabrevis TaxID=357278 RepID=UPI003757207B
MKKFYKVLILGLASLGLFMAGGATTSAQAASKSVKLPSSLKGTWYGYLGKDDDPGGYYAVAKLSITNKKITVREYTTKKKSLKSLKWFTTIAIPTTYIKKSKGVYRVHSRITMDSESLGTISRKAVKVKVLKNKKHMALKLGIDHDNFYAFRTPLRSHAWIYDFSG